MLDDELGAGTKLIPLINLLAFGLVKMKERITDYLTRRGVR